MRPEFIYELLGVRFFKTYLLPTEHLVRAARGGSALRAGQAHLNEGLKRLVWETKRNEAIHVLALFLMGSVLLAKSAEISTNEWLAILAFNLYANVYPILVQRYNRIRLNRLLNRCAP